jgi:carbon-monoxide dehydrogenase large subunit
MPGSILGTQVRRIEDAELVTGAGTYVANLALPGALHVAFVRSPLAHARITGIDTGPAAAAPGVVAVYTAGDLHLPAHHGLMTLNPDTPRPPLATEKVRFAGEAVAMVAAETPAAAADAAELVDVDYEALPAEVDMEKALRAGACPQFAELGSNLAAGQRSPDGAEALADAEVVVRARIVNPRVAPSPLEGNAIAVDPRGDSEHDIVVWVSTQMPHGFRAQLAGLFGIEPERVRVIAPHVGGAFGAKAGMLSEHTAIVGAARALRRPLRWAEDRSENMVSMPHGRGQIGYYELGLTRDGVITGLRVRALADTGAYAWFNGGLLLNMTYIMAPGPYRIPKVGFDAAAVMTNTTPVGAFRGAGRPEAAAHLERILDLAARQLDIDPAELRRRNFYRPGEFPLRTPVGADYDSGDYDLPLSEALRLAGYEELRAEQARRRAAGDPVALGIGLSAYVEITAGGGGSEYGSVRVHDDGSATVSAGTSAHGQGHGTSFAMLASETLGIPVQRIGFVQSDTAAVPRGGGTGGSRSLQMAGPAVADAAGEVLEKARAQAARMLEAAPEDVELTSGGEFGVRGVPGGTLSWQEVATGAAGAGQELFAGLDSAQAGATYPFGAHVSVVEVDTETGHVRPRAHIAVDDCGRIVNPLLVAGQQHGGLAQGIAQALYEEVTFDPDGQPMTASFADYAIPSAVDLMGFTTANTETPTPLNPLGAKGIGESATIGATPAVANAVVDALAGFGVRHVDMPCTPQRVYRAIQDARAGKTDPWREPPGVFETLPVRAGAAEETGAI